ncbi:hypothetical protein Acr_00g0059860 [Actinidia rufa]|uniref:Uncharacterized protein n=1 Tax=Actinidia rufa TaxID=165716 RepID=A0A7J0DNG7_9ERIC|nr:hypothetical protein Acr_00g0059860 [Actinidia rufa]
MHLRSRLIPKPSANSPLDNQTHTMASNNQAPDLEGLHCEMHGITEKIRIMNENNVRLIQHLTTNNPPPPAAPIQPELERSRHSHRSGDRESQSVKALELDDTIGIFRRGNVQSFLGDLEGLGKNLVQKVFSWDHRLVWRPEQTLYRQFHELPVQAEKCIPPFYSSPKRKESLKYYVKRFNQVVLEVEGDSDKVVFMAMMEGLRPGPLFDSLSKNTPDTQLALDWTT